MSDPDPNAAGQQDTTAIADAIVDANRYLTLATSQQDGSPWLTPLYYTPHRYTDFYWVSAPDAAHSRNLAERPGVSFVIFDSRTAVGEAQAMYATATAGQVPDAELPDVVGVAFSPRFPGVRGMGPAELVSPAPYRLYRARVVRRWILDPVGGGTDQRVEVPPGR